MARLVRLETWTDVECNAGTRSGIIPRSDCLAIEEYVELGGEDELRVAVDPNSAAWALVAHGVVVRATYDDDDYDEYRIRKIARKRSAKSTDFSFTAKSIKFDLDATILRWEQVNGQVLLHHELIHIQTEDVIDSIIATGLLPSYIVKGTIEDTKTGPTEDPARYAFSLDWETPLAGLREVAKVADLEFTLRRNGATNYMIDMLVETNAAAEKPHIRFRKNMLSNDVEENSSEMGTIIFPRGEGPQGNAPTVGPQRWKMRTVGGAGPQTTQLLTPWLAYDVNTMYAIGEADQFNGFYIEMEDNTMYEILDSDLFGAVSKTKSGIAITIDTAIDVNGEIVKMREKATVAGEGGVELIYIPVPSAQAIYGDRVVILDRADVPGIVNLVFDPFIENWQNANAHFTVGSPTVSKVVGPDPKVHYGASSLKVEADTGEGLQINIADNTTVRNDIIDRGNPNLSFQVWLYLEQGEVEFYIDVGSPMVKVSTGEVVARIPAADSIDDDGNDVSSAKTSLIDPTDGDKGRFFHLTIEPQLFDFQREYLPGGVENAWRGDSIQFMLLATTDSTIFYADALQMVNNVVVAEKFVNGSNYAQLWDAAIRAMPDITVPKVTLSTDSLDLFRLDSATYPYDELNPGVTCVISDSGVELEEERRIYSLKRDLLREAVTALELADPDIL